MFLKRIGILLFWMGALAADPSLILDLENDQAALIEGRVNALTGRVSLHEEDLAIQGVEPIRISRTYIDDKQGDWRLKTRSLSLCHRSLSQNFRSQEYRHL